MPKLAFAVFLLPALLLATSSASATSPGSNGSIAFTRGRPSQIFVMNPDGRHPKAITSGAHYKFSAAWSPSGGRFAYVVADKYGSSFPQDLFVARRDGTHQRRVVDRSARTGISSPSWSPDGKRIAFLMGPPRVRRIYVVNVDGTHLHRVRFRGYVGYWAEWSPDGKRIAFEGGRGHCGDDIFSVRATGGHLRKMTCNITKKPKGTDGDKYGEIAGLSWSPDGKRLSFAAARGDSMSVTIHTMSRRGDARRKLLSGETPSFSPDGRFLVYEHNLDIYRMQIDGSEVTRLTHTKTYETTPRWQPR